MNELFTRKLRDLVGIRFPSFDKWSGRNNDSLDLERYHEEKKRWQKRKTRQHLGVFTALMLIGGSTLLTPVEQANQSLNTPTSPKSTSTSPKEYKYNPVLIPTEPPKNVPTPTPHITYLPEEQKEITVPTYGERIIVHEKGGKEPIGYNQMWESIGPILKELGKSSRFIDIIDVIHLIPDAPLTKNPNHIKDNGIIHSFVMAIREEESMKIPNSQTVKTIYLQFFYYLNETEAFDIDRNPIIVYYPQIYMHYQIEGESSGPYNQKDAPQMHVLEVIDFYQAIMKIPNDKNVDFKMPTQRERNPLGSAAYLVMGWNARQKKSNSTWPILPEPNHSIPDTATRSTPPPVATAVVESEKNNPNQTKPIQPQAPSVENKPHTEALTQIQANVIDSLKRAANSGPIIDISLYQNNRNGFELANLEPRPSMVIIKSSQAAGPDGINDPMYQKHLQEAKKLGIPVSAYHLVRPDLGYTAEEEADFFYDKTKPETEKNTFKYLALDLEFYGKDAANLPNYCVRFFKRLKERGYSGKLLLYINLSTLTQYKDSWHEVQAIADGLWVAVYSQTNPGTAITIDRRYLEGWKSVLHQFTDKAGIRGYENGLDTSLWLVSDNSSTAPTTDRFGRPINWKKPGNLSKKYI